MTRPTDTNDETKPSAVAREHTRGRGFNDPEQDPHAGLVQDKTLRRLLSALADHYDPQLAAEAAGKDPSQMPADVTDTKLWQKILGREATDTLSQAVHAGHESTVSYFSGDPDTGADISGLSAITRLENEMLTSAPIVMIYGQPGSGKTNFALLLAELWKKQHPNGSIGSNIRTWDEADKWIPSWPDLDSWLDQQLVDLPEGGIRQRDDAEPRLFVFDEASSHAAGHGKQGYETKDKLAPALFKIRKANAGLVIIGHEGKDVAPSIRALATIVDRGQGDMDEAGLYESISDRTPKGHIMDLAGIPETSYNYDDTEATSWSWSHGQQDPGDSQQDAEEIKQLAEDLAAEDRKRFAVELWRATDLNQSDVGEIIAEAEGREDPYTQNTIAKWKGKYEDQLDENHD